MCGRIRTAFKGKKIVNVQKNKKIIFSINGKQSFYLTKHLCLRELLKALAILAKVVGLTPLEKISTSKARSLLPFGALRRKIFRFVGK